MTAQFPVHIDDHDQLMRIRRYLIGFRVTNGWTQQELSRRINGTAGMVYSLESDESWQWRMSRLQKWPRPFGLRLDAKVVFASKALTRAVHADPEVAPFWEFSRQNRREWPMWQRTYLTAALSLGRRRQNISSAKMAQMAGITRKAVSGWESVADEVMLPKVLHYARIMNARIELGLVESDGLDVLPHPRMP